MTPPPLPPPPPADPACMTPSPQTDDLEERSDLFTWMSWSAAVAMNA